MTTALPLSVYLHHNNDMTNITFLMKYSGQKKKKKNRLQILDVILKS